MALAMGNSKNLCITTILGFLLLITVSCNSQNAKDKMIINGEEMEQNNKETHDIFKNYIPVKKFNIEKFNIKNKKGEYFFVDNGMEVRQMENIDYSSEKIDGYYEYRKYPNAAAYEFFSEYDINGLLMLTVTTFYNIEFGTVKHYDKSGNVTKEENLDTSYKFSLDELIRKMKDEYKINILIPSLIFDINRYIVSEMNLTLYEVKVKGQIVDYKIHVYLIDGNTGETLLITSRETEWSGYEQEDVIDEYIRKKANGEL